MRYMNSKLLKKFRCVMIRIYSFVVATIRKYSHTSVNRSSLNVNHSLKFTMLCSPMLEEIKNLSIYNMYLFAKVRTLSQRFVMGSSSVA